jgi:hypothetical protein
MNRISSKLLAAILVTAITLSAMPAISCSVPPPPCFYILPDTVSFDTGTTNVGYKFNVTIWVETTAPDSYVWQCKVLFNTTQLHADRAAYTGGSKSEWFLGYDTVPVTPIINNVTGYVIHGEALTGTESKGPSSGSLFWIEFEIWSAPAPGTTLTSLITTDSPDTYVLDTNLFTEPGFTNGYCTYSYAWSPPPHPHLEVINYTENTFAINAHWIGTTFNEYIYIKSLSVAWYLTNVTVDFGYNGTLLSVTNVIFDPLWIGPNSTVNAPGDLTLFVQNPSSNPSGDVLIATVTMKIMTQAEAPPYPYGYYDQSLRELLNPVLYSSYSSVGLIPVDPQPATKPILVFAYRRPHLYVQPEVTVVERGGTFSIDVNVDDVTDLFVSQIVLNYNSTILTPINVEIGWLFRYGALSYGEYGIYGPWFEPQSWVLVGDYNGDFNGSCTLCRITFLAETEGISYLNFSLPWTPNYWDYWGVSRRAVTFDTFLWDQYSRDIPFDVINGEVRVLPIVDVAATNVTPAKSVVGQGYITYINATVQNQGDYEETFNVTVYANTTYIASQNVTLTSGNSTTITFTWNATGFAKGNYTISAYAWPVQGETDTADNTFTDGWVIVAMIGDITGPDGYPDGKCDMRDVGLVARHFGETVPPAPPDCDITGPTGVPDGVVDMRDIGLVARHFGETDP